MKVEDRTIIKCNEDETQCVAPETIQPLINQIVAKIPKGRSFVRLRWRGRVKRRPSGTENVVRVYAEADTMEHAKELSKTVERIVFDCAKGVGERPFGVCSQTIDSVSSCVFFDRDKGDTTERKMISLPFSVPTTSPFIIGLHTAMFKLSLVPKDSYYVPPSLLPYV